MAVPTRTPLGATTTNRMWYVDVDTSTSSSPTWTPVQGVMELQTAREPHLEEDSDFDSAGFQSQTKTAEQWSLVTKLARKVTADSATAYDPGQEALRQHALGKMGPANSVHVRWYEMEPDGPREEAYEGNAAVGWSPDGGAMTALSTVTCTLTGQGEAEEIAHPDGGTAAAPTVTALDPATGSTSGGDLVAITGTGLTDATAVKFDTTDATDYDVVSGTLIEAVAPAGSAGDVDVTVTTAAGTSGTSAATKYTYAA